MSLLKNRILQFGKNRQLSISRLPAKSPIQSPWICSRCLRQQRRYAQTAVDDPNFTSIVDHPAKLVRTGRKHGYGIIILALIPITAFVLGTWQIQRLSWKTTLITRFEDRLVRDPLTLPPRIDPNAIADFDYRRVAATGRFRHDQEMLVGPRLHDGHDGFLVITPLERDGGEKILVNRGWIAKEKRAQRNRRSASADALPEGRVMVQGLLREPWKRNWFTPVNRPDRGEFYFPDVGEMAAVAGAQAVWVEETMEPDLLMALDREEKGVPIGRPAEVNLRNTHLQYIFTWYSLSLATSVMLWMVLRKPPSSIARRVRQNREW